jgi:hypothetical protein
MSGQLHVPTTLPTGKPAGIPFTGRRVGPRTCLDAMVERKISCLCRDSNLDFSAIQTITWPLHWLSCPGSDSNNKQTISEVFMAVIWLWSSGLCYRVVLLAGNDVLKKRTVSIFKAEIWRLRNWPISEPTRYHNPDDHTLKEGKYEKLRERGRQRTEIGKERMNKIRRKDRNKDGKKETHKGQQTQSGKKELL